MDSSANSQQLDLPPGFRFHPTDDELIVHYLVHKVSSTPLPVHIMAEIDLYKFDPWELPDKAIFGEREWYFFSPRDRKYPNGARPNRATTSGYWKATGTDKPIYTSTGNRRKVGVKKALVFYCGKPPKGTKTDWIMHEFRLTEITNSASKPPLAADTASKKASLRLDDWVLCRIYKKGSPPGGSVDLAKGDDLGQQNTKPPASQCVNFAPPPPEVNVEDHFFEEMLPDSVPSNAVGSHHQFPSSTSKPDTSTLHIGSTNYSGILGHAGAPPQYWNGTTPQEYHGSGGVNVGNSNNGIYGGSSFTSLLNPQNSFLGNSMGNGDIRQQFQFNNSINWKPK